MSRTWLVIAIVGSAGWADKEFDDMIYGLGLSRMAMAEEGVNG